jgi:hypothetical protein
MIKADAKVVYEKNKPEKFTHFELLQQEVEVLKETVDEIVAILKANNIHRTEEIEAEYFDLDEVFRKLEED